MKIVITNATLANGGDAAIVYSMIELLRRTFGADTRISVVDSLAAVARGHYPDLDIRQALGMHRPAGAVQGRRTSEGAGLWQRFRARIGRKVRSLRIRAALAARRRGLNLARLLLGPEEQAAFNRYAEAEMVISVGGTYLVDHYDIRPRLLEFDIARAHGRKPLFFTQSLGPFERSGLRESVAGYFRDAPLILLRDERSRQCLDAIGIGREKMHVMADGVFAFADPDILRAAAQGAGTVRRIAISVRNWSHFKGSGGDQMAQYRAGIARTVEMLLRDHDCDITFISTCQGIAAYQAQDSRVAEAIVSELAGIDRSRVRVDSAFHRPSELMELIRQFDLVIATRMHMAILALCAGIPVLPIAYEFKTQELFERLGMGEWTTAIEDVTPGDFPAHVTRFLSALPGRRAALFAAVEREYDRALEAGPLLRAASGTA